MPQTKLPINIDNLLQQRTVESERVEYKQGWNPESVLHTLCAFANDFQNLGGGYLVMGITEAHGQPILPPRGLLPEQIDSIQKALLNLGNSAIQPPYHPLTAVYQVQGKHILVLWIPGGETRPYKAKTRPNDKKSDWAFYVRKQSSTVKAVGETERELLSLAATVPFDDRYRQSTTLEALSPTLIRDYLHEVGSELAAEASRLSVEQLAARMNIVGGPIEVRIDAQELMVLSFPGPDRSISLADLEQGKGVSRRYRNRRIGEFLKELDLTEGRSTGLPKVLRVMQQNGSPTPVFETDEERNYFLIRLPVHEGFVKTEQATPEVTPEVTPEIVCMLAALTEEMTRAEIMAVLGLKDEKHFRVYYQQACISKGLIEMTIPDKPRSRLQKYRLTPLGKQTLTATKT